MSLFALSSSNKDLTAVPSDDGDGLQCPQKPRYKSFLPISTQELQGYQPKQCPLNHTAAVPNLNSLRKGHSKAI